MLDSYSEGQTLTKEDFFNPLYFPEGEYSSATIDNIDDENVTLTYHTFDNPDADSTVILTREEMKKALGWSK